MTAARTNPTMRLRVAAAAACASTALALLASPERVEAGSYLVTQCSDVPGYVAIPGAHGETNTTPFGFSADCTTPGAFKMGVGVYTEGASSVAAGGYGAWVWDAPQGAAFKSASFQYLIFNNANLRGHVSAAAKRRLCDTVSNHTGTEWRDDDAGQQRILQPFRGLPRRGRAAARRPPPRPGSAT